MLPPAIIVHGLPDIRTALAPGRPVTLLSAPGAATYVGAAWWAELLRIENIQTPAFLDCAAAPGRAFEALALGLSGIILAPCPVWNELAAHAAARRATLLAAAPPALDLAAPGAAHALESWLEGGITGIYCPKPPAGT